MILRFYNENYWKIEHSGSNGYIKKKKKGSTLIKKVKPIHYKLTHFLGLCQKKLLDTHSSINYLSGASDELTVVASKK